jgi:peptidoglycan/LPS O-acetylase OafA/YrhL
VSDSAEGYRPDIDGLRAVAVAAVIVYHAFPAILPGGLFGVDVFFVISGYLITGLILGGIASGRFSLAGFYARRIRRLLPALVVMLAAVFAIGAWLLLPVEFERLCEEIASGALFISNFEYLSQVGYFDRDAALKPLLHLWSLGVEEQFYLTWPLLLLMCRAQRVRSMAAVIGVASLMTALVLEVDHPAAAFFLPVTRFWELMLGAGLAAGVNPVPTTPAWRGVAAFAGFLLVLVSLAASPQQLPSLWRLLPTVGTALLIASGPSARINKSLLSNGALVATGKISYPLYLWHWPLLSFLAISRMPEEPAVGSRLAAIAAAIVLSGLTYRFVEAPLRFGRWRPLAVPVLSAALAVCAAGGYGGAYLDGLPSRFPEPIRGYLRVQANWEGEARLGTCWLKPEAAPQAIASSCHPGGGTWVWGDSHAGHLYLGISGEFAGPVGELIRDGCAPIFDLGDEGCVQGNEFILSLIRESPPETLIMFAVWNNYPIYDASTSDKLVATIDQARAAGVRRILVVGPAPQWTEDLPRVMYEEWRATGKIPDRLRQRLAEAAFSADRALKVIVGRTSANYLSLLDALCDERGCLARVGDDPQGLIAYDYGHMTQEGARYVARLIRDRALRTPTSVSGSPSRPN